MAAWGRPCPNPRDLWTGCLTRQRGMRLQMELRSLISWPGDGGSSLDCPGVHRMSQGSLEGEDGATGGTLRRLLRSSGCSAKVCGQNSAVSKDTGSGSLRLTWCIDEILAPLPHHCRGDPGLLVGHRSQLSPRAVLLGGEPPFYWRKWLSKEHAPWNTLHSGPTKKRKRERERWYLREEPRTKMKPREGEEDFM